VVDAVSTSLGILGDALAADDPQPAEVLAAALLLAGSVATATEHVAAAAARAAAGQDPAFVAATGLVEELPRRLLDWMAVERLDADSYPALDALRALDVVEVEPVPPDPGAFTTEHVHRAVRLDRLTGLLTDPRRWWREAYGWGTAQSRLDILLERLFRLGISVGLPVTLAGADLHRVEVLGTTVDPAEAETPRALLLPLFSGAAGGVDVEAGLGLVVLPADGTAGEGLALTPYATGTARADIPLDLLGTWVASITGGLGAEGGIGLVARPGEPIRALADLDGTGGAATGQLEVALVRQPDAPQRAVIRFGGTSGLLVTGVSARALARFETGKPAELAVELTVRQASLRIAMSEADGFLRSVLPDLAVVFDAGFGLSTTRGAYFVGGAGLELSAPLGLVLGPVTVERLTARLAARAAGSPAGITADFGAAVALRLGPFAVEVDGLGARLTLDQRAGGNLGPVDAALGFRPPTGIGLAIDLPAVSGGGFLYRDPVAGRYAGVFELTLLDTVSVKVIGLVTTALPDGRPGFALLLVITAEGFTPVPLGMGFTLTGVGGLIALNRTIDADAVRGGLASGVLDSVLFARDPVANADRILATLDRVFPLARDRLLLGPLAEITWGSPTIVRIRLALLLEIPAPVRAVLLAALSVLLPDPDEPVAELHVDAVGVLDLTRGELALDASLHHSRLATFTLTGDLALRLNWGSQPQFLMSVGGFHPRFTPPAGLRRLDRMTISLSDSDNPRIRFEAYLAVTSNTVQLGARVSLRAEKGGFGVEGGGGFDALVQWDPFGVDVLMDAWVRVFSPAGTLFGAKLSVEITGPQPWHVVGVIRFDVLWWTVEAGVDFTVGDPIAPLAASAVDVVRLLAGELARAESWSAALPAGVAPGVALGGAVGAALVHPLARVSVRQKVVPLATAVSRVGAARPVGGTRRYDLDAVTASGSLHLAAAPVTDHFALAQFTDLSEDEKLAAPSFSRLPAGLSFVPDQAGGIPLDRVLTTDLAFETLDLQAVPA
jgi:hypothetical protein